MSMPIGNREKIAGLIILGLVTVGLIHYFVFMPRAAEYRSAYAQYRSAAARFSTSITKEAAPQIARMEQANSNMMTTVTTLAKDLKIDMEPLFFTPGPERVKQYQDRFVTLVNQIVDLRRSPLRVKPDFLDWGAGANVGQGWDIPAQLTGSSAQLWDNVEKLSFKASEMKVLDNPRDLINARFGEVNPMTRQLVKPGYIHLLQNIGVNWQRLQAAPPGPSEHQRRLGIEPFPPQYRRPDTVAIHGEIVPTIKKLAHAKLIWEQKLRDERTPGVRIPIQTKEDIYALLEVKLPDDPVQLYLLNKQLELLLQLIQMADKEGVERLVTVQLLPMRKVDDIPDLARPGRHRLASEVHFDQLLQLAALSSQANAYGGSSYPGSYGSGGYPGSYGGPYGGAYGGGAGYGGPGGAYPVNPGAPAWGPSAAPGGYPGAPVGAPGTQITPTPTPTPQPLVGGDWAGTCMPMQLKFVANWENTIKYTYRMTHHRNPFEVDSARLESGSQFNEPGKIVSTVTVAPMVRVKGLELLYSTAPAPDITPVIATPTPYSGYGGGYGGSPGEPTAAQQTPAAGGGASKLPVEY